MQEETDGSSAFSKLEREIISPDNVRHLLFLLLLLTACYLSHSGVFVYVIDFFLNDHVFRVDRAYLKAASKTSEETFAIISGIKTALALIQSSEGGISFIVEVNVRLGEAANVIVEFINISWFVSLVSIFSIEVLSLLLELSISLMAPAMTFFFAMWGVSYGVSMHFSRVGDFFARISKCGLFLVVLAHFVIPLVIYLSASASQFLYAENSYSVHQGYQEVSGKLSGHTPNGSLHDQVKHAISTYSDVQGDLPTDTNNYSSLTVKHLVFSLIEYVLTPILLLFALGGVALLIIRKLDLLGGKGMNNV